MPASPIDDSESGESPRDGKERKTLFRIAAVIVAVLLGIVGLALMTFGQFPALLLVALAIFIGWWAKRRTSDLDRDVTDGSVRRRPRHRDS